jgi:fatty aldehyde-generating acyl-ACP reductase
MYDFALIIHPTSEELLCRYEPGIRHRPRPLVKKVLEWMSPFLAAEVEGLSSHLGRTAVGALVMCPLLTEQMVALSPTRVMKAVNSTLEFAQTLEPKLIGLTAYTAFSGNKGKELAKHVDIPLTTGSNYTLAMIPEAILRAADLMERDLSASYILILGVTSSVGRYCLEILTHFVAGMFVTAQNPDKFGLLLSDIPKEKRGKLHFCPDISPVLDKVNIVIIATNHIPAEFDIHKLSPGTVIFDSSYPRHIEARKREDILVIDGVATRPPGKVNFNFDFGLPEHLCYPCMAEPMILALERRYQDYSLGKDFQPEKIREMIRLGARHGFEIAALTSQERLISSEEIRKVKSRVQGKKKKKSLWR